MTARQGFFVGLVILITVLLVRECSHGDMPEKQSSHTEVHNYYYYDTTIHKITINTPSALVDSFPFPVPQHVDTAAILKKYYTEYIYHQESADSNLQISITDTITQNMIKGRNLTYKLLRPVKIEQTVNNVYASKKKYAVFAGIHGGCSLTGIRSIGPEAIVIHNNLRAYKLNYNFIDKSINAGIHWKLGR
jgi:hypothetical protein